MKTNELLNHLHNLRVQIRADGQKLVCNAPKGVLTDELRDLIVERKQDIIKLLQEPNSVDFISSRPIVTVQRDGNLPLSSGQQRLWYLDQLEPNLSVYNHPVAFKLKGRLDISVMRRTLNEIIRRHEVLRTTFELDEDLPVQIIAPSLEIELPVFEFKGLPIKECGSQLSQILETEAHRPFDLAKGPLVRAMLVKLAEEEHVFFFMAHHSVFDGWSFGLFQKELIALYESFVSGTPSPLAELPIQYADFAIWQREWLQGQESEQQLDYWREQLSGELPVLQMPSDYPRPAIQSYKGSREVIHIPKTLVESLEALGRQHGASLFMVVLAAFKTLLYRYTGQEELIVSTPIAGRQRPETEALIGFFVNTLVLRTSMREAPSFNDLLSRVREICLGAYSHQDIPFERLVEELQPERDLSRTPLYQAMIIYHTEWIDHFATMAGISWQPVPIHPKVSQTDLTLYIIKQPEGFNASIVYSTDLFNSDTIVRMLKHFKVLLEGMVADPDTSIEELPLLTEAERQQILVEWNANEADYPRELCLHQLFEAQVEKTPESVAVAFEETSLTYKELNKRANQLAHYLQALDVGPDIFVGIFVERSAEMLIGLLGILKAGGAYVPLDPNYPKERLAYMMGNAGLKILITQEYLKADLPNNKARIIGLDSDWEEISQHSDSNPGSRTTPDNLAYVIYTSGSTGKPKGVQVPHGAVVNFLASMAREPGLNAQDVLVAVTTLSFDIHVLELYLPLIVGAKIVVVSRPVASDGIQLLEVLKRSGATVMQATPTTWRLLLTAGWKGSENLKILCGGEAFQRDLVKDLLSRSTSVWNMYGPTETTVWSTCYELKDPDGTILVGKPIANTTCYILDNRMQPVPVGVPGELYIGGAGMTRGYLKRPKLNAKQFLPDPFNKDQSAYLYRTGDLAKYHPDGNIEYLNRLDNQVKVRGFRIELGEIETVLTQHEAVAQGVVTIKEAQPGDERLIAFIVTEPGHNFDVAELRKHLRDKLPEYMIPQHFAETDEMPLTPAGKIDRKGITESLKIEVAPQGEFVAPRNETEQLLATIWQDVLGVDRVGIYDNFFDIGGHSLLATQFISRLKRSFQTKINLRQLFQAPTIQQLASILDQQETSSSLTSLVLLQDGRSKPPFYCVPGMLGNVFMDLSYLVRHLGKDQTVYGLQDGLDLPSKVEALAAHFIDEIRTVQPKGPYFIGGICFGAALAFEMAQQLRNQGDEVGLISLVEPTRPTFSKLRAYIRHTVFILRMLARRGGHHSHNFLQLSPDEKKVYFGLRMKVIANLLALARYVPTPYPGRIHIFFTHQSLVSSRNLRLGWHELANDGAEIHEIPGTHRTITGLNDTPIEEAHMQVLAKKLKVCIDKILLKRASSHYRIFSSNVDSNFVEN